MKPSRHRSEEDKARVHQAMLEAAAEILFNEGYDKLTLAKVGKQVGFTTTNVYRYFESKDDLIYKAIESSFIEFGKRIEGAYHLADNAFERVSAIGRAYLKFAEDYPVAYHLLFMEKSAHLFEDRVVPGVDKIYYLQKAIHEGMEDDSFRQGNVQAIANMLWMQMHGIVSLSNTMVFIDEIQRKEVIEEVFLSTAINLSPR